MRVLLYKLFVNLNLMALGFGGGLEFEEAREIEERPPVVRAVAVARDGEEPRLQIGFFAEA